MTERLIIRTETAARAYLATRGMNIETATVRVSTACGRCGGDGYGGWYPDGGVCYDCNGAKTRGNYRAVPIIEYARGERRREMARNRAARKATEKAAATKEAQEAGQRRWCEANGYGALTFEERDEARETARKAAEKVAEAARGGASTHVGELGKRLELRGRVEAVRTYEAQGWGYGAGMETRYVYTIRVGRDTIVTFGRCLDLDRGDDITFRGTVKEHGDYKGEAQTTLNRVAVRERHTAPPEPEAFTYAPGATEIEKNHCRILNNAAARMAA